ncbi:hypothetical protein [Polyangium sorediatum]|uniref:Uncharacterized protein n=1 Tax=Polyangium sorediatum TaxID=889274 RepID=A0ABT6P4G5_9BACT|nr:hypothetical protein [Polyangium sorediatum]MDI1435453.1 hypothetical protein [Polyangium sorediatum]
MSRSRVRDRARLQAPVETTDPAALAAYAGALRPLVTALRAGIEDATARPSQRQRARLALRKDMLRQIRTLEARLDVADPPAP